MKAQRINEEREIRKYKTQKFYNTKWQNCFRRFRIESAIKTTSSGINIQRKIKIEFSLKTYKAD